MIDLASFAVPALEHVVTWERLGWWMLKLTAIAGIGHLLLVLLGRASAATRHLVAMAALIAIVGVPLATTVLPSWPLAIWREDLVSPTPPRDLPTAPNGVAAVVAAPAPLPASTDWKVKRMATSAAASFPLTARPRESAPLAAVP